MPPIVLIAATVLVALCALLVSRAGATERRGTTLIPVIPLAYIALLLAYVFGEDSYRGNGISRWDAYRSPGGALEPMFVATIALMFVAAGAMTLALVQHRRRLMRASALGAGAVALFLGIPTVMGFSLN